MITCRKMLEIFKRADKHYPISDRYLVEVHKSPDATGHDEKEHMLAWFKSQGSTGCGSYTRKKANSDAERTYNMLQNAASLLWIAEAVGVDADTVEHAYCEAVKVAGMSRGHQRACGAIRKVIPWSKIEKRLCNIKL